MAAVGVKGLNKKTTVTSQQPTFRRHYQHFSFIAVVDVPLCSWTSRSRVTINAVFRLCDFMSNPLYWGCGRTL